MAINAYTGLMGSGKSYEVVSEVILPAILAGRRVVTNVDGISNDLIREYLFETKNIPLQRLGTVVHCTNEDVFAPDFFPYYDDKKSAVTDTFVQAGDLVCIDEAWRFWGTDKKLHPHHRSFFLEHRHFVHPDTHVACDLVLMIQDMGTLHRFIKSVVAFSFRTHKKVSLGLNNTYSVNMWEGSKQVKGGLIGTWVRKYRKEIFPLYSSFKGGVGGKSVNSDARQNILLNKRLWFMLLLGVVGAFFAVRGIYKFLNPSSPKIVSASASATATAGRPASASAKKTNDEKKLASENWRLVGTMNVKGRYWVLLANSAGRVRAESPSVFREKGAYMTGLVDGEIVSFWSGSLSDRAPDMPTLPSVGK